MENLEGSAAASEVTPQEKAGANIIGAEGPAEFQGDSLFGEAVPTEAELRGEEGSLEGVEDPAPPQSSEDKPEPKDESSEAPKETPKEDPKEDPKPDVEAKEEKKPEGGKPPEGYVPLAALHEERQERKKLAKALEQMQEKMTSLESAPKKEAKETGAEEPFKVLSDEEYEELLEENVFEALKYDRRLKKHQDEQGKVAKAQEAEKEIVRSTAKAIEEAVPGIYDDSTGINYALTSFAINNGFRADDVAVLTHPGTKIIPPGQKEPILLGKGAAAVVSLLYKFYSSEKELKPRLEKEITEQVTKKITGEVMGKLKKDTGYKSLGDAPGNSDSPTGKTLSEAQFNRLSAADQRKYLGA